MHVLAQVGGEVAALGDRARQTEVEVGEIVAVASLGIEQPAA